MWEFISVDTWCQLKIHTKQCSILPDDFNQKVESLMLSDNSYWTVLNAVRGFSSS